MNENNPTLLKSNHILIKEISKKDTFFKYNNQFFQIPQSVLYSIYNKKTEAIIFRISNKLLYKTYFSSAISLIMLGFTIKNRYKQGADNILNKTLLLIMTFYLYRKLKNRTMLVKSIVFQRSKFNSNQITVYPSFGKEVNTFTNSIFISKCSRNKIFLYDAYNKNMYKLLLSDCTFTNLELSGLVICGYPLHCQGQGQSKGNLKK